MKTSHDCSGWREDIRTWVAEGVAGELSAQVQHHLADCADCRRYAAELRAAVTGLRRLADRPADPSPGFRARWTRAVEDAACPASLGETVEALAAWWRGLVLRNVRPILALAPLWILALSLRLSTPIVSPTPQATRARSPIEIFRALKASEQLLAGELRQPTVTPAAGQTPQSARPRSEGLRPAPRAHAPHLTHLAHLAHASPVTSPSPSHHGGLLRV